MTEQSGARELVDYAVAAERAGFDFEVCSDHFTPWLTAQGHAPYAWAVLGAAAHATSAIELMTYVTCPTMRYHPAVVAQKAATMGMLAEGRFTLGVGSGENLNEHVVGEGWPAVDVRQSMLQEAIQIIRSLHSGELTTWEGEYFRVDSARIWDVPDGAVPIAVAVSGEDSVARFADLADHAIAVEPDRDLLASWDHAHGPGSRKIGQVPICWDPDEDVAIDRAYDQFRWFGGGWAVTPTSDPAGIDAASKFARRGRGGRHRVRPGSTPAAEQRAAIRRCRFHRHRDRGIATRTSASSMSGGRCPTSFGAATMIEQPSGPLAVSPSRPSMYAVAGRHETDEGWISKGGRRVTLDGGRWAWRHHRQPPLSTGGSPGRQLADEQDRLLRAGAST